VGELLHAKWRAEILDSIATPPRNSVRTSTTTVSFYVTWLILLMQADPSVAHLLEGTAALLQQVFRSACKRICLLPLEAALCFTTQTNQGPSRLVFCSGVGTWRSGVGWLLCWRPIQGGRGRSDILCLCFGVEWALAWPRWLRWGSCGLRAQLPVGEGGVSGS